MAKFARGFQCCTAYGVPCHPLRLTQLQTNKPPSLFLLNKHQHYMCYTTTHPHNNSIPFILARLRGSHPRVDRFMDSAAHWMGAAPLPHPPKNSKEPAPNSFLRSLKATKYNAPVGGGDGGGADVEAGAVEGELVASAVWCVCAPCGGVAVGLQRLVRKS